MFARYAAIVKNLRGVVLFNMDEEGVEDSIKWLVNRFRYRDLGLTPRMYQLYSQKLGKYIDGRPFRVLTYPLRELEKFTNDFAECVQIDYLVAELLILSSLYISPAMIIGSTYEPVIRSLSSFNIGVCKELSVNDWKLHMRIADYSILDMYEFAVTTALKVVESCSEEEARMISASREDAIKRDTKRYWRILCKDKPSRAFMYYVDNLKLYTERCKLERICKTDVLAASLAVVPVIVVPAKMK